MLVVSSTIHKLSLSKPGGNAIDEFDAHLDRSADALRKCVKAEPDEVIGFARSMGSADQGAPHLP
jgi:hypothetical protein